MIRSNFTQTPNIAFDLLTNEFDLVGYQKLLRCVGIGNKWKGGNRALAEKLNMSYGRVVKLRAKLLAVKFISIEKSDNARGEADAWELLDIFDYKNDTLSRNEQGWSRNESGQESEIETEKLNKENTSVKPCHETNHPLSRNEPATLSRNEPHKENIYSSELIQDTNLQTQTNARAKPTESPPENAAQIVERVLKFTPSNFTAEALEDSKITDRVLWEQILNEKKAGMTDAQSKDLTWKNKSVQFALTDYGKRKLAKQNGESNNGSSQNFSSGASNGKTGQQSKSSIVARIRGG